MDLEKGYRDAGLLPEFMKPTVFDKYMKYKLNLELSKVVKMLFTDSNHSIIRDIFTPAIEKMLFTDSNHRKSNWIRSQVVMHNILSLD